MDYISTDFTHITFWSLFASILVLQILDMHSTHTALTAVTKKGHKLIEGNPFVQGAMERFGIIGGMVITKLPFVLLMVVFLQPHWIHNTVLFVLCGFYAYTVRNNYKLIKNYSGDRSASSS